MKVMVALGLVNQKVYEDILFVFVMRCKVLFVIFLTLLIVGFSFGQAMTDVDKIILKLKGQDSTIEPPDSRTVQQIFEAISLSDKATLLTRVVDESLTKKLWDDITTDENRKELIKAGLSEEKTKELLDVWEKVKEKRDFILKKMDEVSESDPKNKIGFEKFSSEYIKENNLLIDPAFEFEYKELNRYSLGYVPKTSEPEFVEVSYDSGLILKFPLNDLPMGLKKIEVNGTHITYTAKYGGKFIVNVTDIYPTDMGSENEWEVKNFLDLAGNDYEVVIGFGEKRNGIISTFEGGFSLLKGAYVVIDDTSGTIYNLNIWVEDDLAFIRVYDDGVYVFRGDVITSFDEGGHVFNFTEVAIDKSGVLTDISGRFSVRFDGFYDSSGALSGNLADYSYKFLSLSDDSLSEGGKIITGNLNEVFGRRFLIISDGGIDYELPTRDLNINSGHLVKGNSLVLQQGFINSQRLISGASDGLFDFSRVGSSLVDNSGRRGDSNGGSTFADFWKDIFVVVDRYLSYSVERFFLNEFGYFIG